MKAVKGLSFGFSSVNAGKRNGSVAPEVIVSSTEGGFRISPAVSKVLGIAHGDYAMFLNNIDNLDEAIREQDETLVAFVEELGLEWGSAEAAIAIHKEYDKWIIAKGINEFDSFGNNKTVPERLTKNDRVRYVTKNFDEMLEAAMLEAPKEVKEALTVEGITREEQVEILAQFVPQREVPKFKGSKCANPAQLSGVGVSLTFSDSNVWKELKVDLGDEATSVNRVYTIDFDMIQKVAVNNGYEDVIVEALVLDSYTDKSPARIGSKSEE